MSVTQGLRLAVAASLLASVAGACQGADPYYRNQPDADFTGAAGAAGFHPDLAGFTGSDGSAAGAADANDSGAADAVDADATGPCTTCMVRVQYTCRSTAPPHDDTGQASFVLDVTNESSQSFALSSLTLRYWYTIDVGKPQELDCDLAKIGCTNLVTSADTPGPRFVPVMPAKKGANEYVEIAFTPGALDLDPLLDTGEIQLRLHNADFSPIVQTDDYSYDCSMMGNAVDSMTITAYLDGVLIWGTEPPSPVP